MTNMFKKLILISSLLFTALPVNVIAEEPAQDPNSSETGSEATEVQNADETSETDKTTTEEIIVEEPSEPAEEEPAEAETTEENKESEDKEETQYDCPACKVDVETSSEKEEEGTGDEIDPEDRQPFLNELSDYIPVEGALDFTIYEDPNAMEIDNAQITTDLYNLAELETESGTLEEYFGRGEYESDGPSQAEIDTEDNRKNGTPVIDDESSYEEAPASEEPAVEESYEAVDESVSDGSEASPTMDELDDDAAIQAAVQSALDEMNSESDFSKPKVAIKSFVNSLVTHEMYAADSAYLYFQAPYPVVVCGGIYGMSNGYHGAYAATAAWSFNYAVDSNGDPVFCLEPWKPMAGSYDDGKAIVKGATITVNSDADTVRLDATKLNNLAWACTELYRRHRSPEAFYVGQLALWNAVLNKDVQAGIDFVNHYNNGNSDPQLLAYVTALSNWGYGSPVAYDQASAGMNLAKINGVYDGTNEAVWSGGASGTWGGLPDIDWKKNGIGAYGNELKEIYQGRLDGYGKMETHGELRTDINEDHKVTMYDCGKGYNYVDSGSVGFFTIKSSPGNTVREVTLTAVDPNIKIYKMSDLAEKDSMNRYHAKPGAVPFKKDDVLSVDTEYFVTLPETINQTYSFSYSQKGDPNQKGGTVYGQSDSCTQDVIVAGEFIDEIVISEMCFTTAPSPINVKKIDSETNALVGDVELALYKVNGNSETFVKNLYAKDGMTETVKVEPGTYRVKETRAPKGYYYARDIDFTVVADFKRTQTFTMEDEPIKYKVVKVDKKNREPMADVILQLRTAGGGILEEWKTTLEPHAIDTSEMRAENTYKIHECSTVPGYLIQRVEVYFTVPKYADEIQTLGYETTDDGSIVVRMENPEIMYSVVKKDAKTGEYIKGATLQLFDYNGKKIDEWVTDGSAHRIEPKKLEEGKTYRVHESKAPDGYYLMSQDKSFTVSVRNDEVETMIFVECWDYPIDYSVTKIDKDTNDVLAGVKLGLYDKNGTQIDSWTTTLEDHVIVPKLATGQTYYVRELETIPGYYLDTQAVPFTVKDIKPGTSKDELTVKFENTRIRVSVQKVDARDPKKPVPGVTLGIYNDEGTKIDEVLTQDKPVMLDQTKLEAGKTYTVREEKTVKGYYFTAKDEKFTIPLTLEEAKKVAKNGAPITVTVKDYPISYQILKIDADTEEPVEGIQLALYDGDTQIDSWVTDGSPHPIEPTLLEPLKTYKVKELSTKNGYYLNPNVETFTVSKTPGENGTIKIKFKNHKVSLKVRKTDTEGNVLTDVDGKGFKFEIYDSNGTRETPDDDRLIDSFDTTSPAYTTAKWYNVPQDKLKAGTTYRIHEAEVPPGYKVADDAFVEVPEVYGNAELTVVVEDEKIEMKLKKVDENGNTLTTYRTPDGKTHGFILDVYKMADFKENKETAKPVYTIDTSSAEYVEKGYADISTKLEFGETYIVNERDYPVGYYKAQDVPIVLDGQTDSVQIVDPKLKAKFRKEDADGSLLTTVDGVGFQFEIYDTNGTPNDTSDDKAIAKIDTKNAGEDGYVDLSDILQEGRTYRFKEVFAPNGYTLAPDKFLTMPTYYQPQE